MIISKYNKSYDTADGSEQLYDAATSAAEHADSPDPVKESAGQDRQDASRAPCPGPPPSPLELSSQPVWSVLSLSDLNAAIRLENWAENPLHRQRRAEEAERQRLRAIEIERERAAATARAERDRYRNHWETS